LFNETDFLLIKKTIIKMIVVLDGVHQHMLIYIYIYSYIYFCWI